MRWGKFKKIADPRRLEEVLAADVDRRTFLKVVGLSVAWAAAPTPIVNAVVQRRTRLIHDSWHIDYSNRIIRYVGPSGGTVPMQELYEYLKEEWAREDTIPIRGKNVPTDT